MGQSSTCRGTNGHGSRKPLQCNHPTLLVREGGGLARAPGLVVTTPSHSQLRTRYTNRVSVLLLAAEDNCLGVNFGLDIPAIAQPFRPNTATVAEMFQADVQALATEEQTAIPSDPVKLISVYAQALIQAFSCHFCLLQDLVDKSLRASRIHICGIRQCRLSKRNKEAFEGIRKTHSVHQIFTSQYIAGFCNKEWCSRIFP